MNIIDGDGNNMWVGVHRMVAQAFIPNPNSLQQVNHKDENPLNNNVDNLEWCDSKYNCNYGTRNKRISDKNCCLYMNLTTFEIKTSRDWCDILGVKLDTLRTNTNYGCKTKGDYYIRIE